MSLVELPWRGESRLAVAHEWVLKAKHSGPTPATQLRRLQRAIDRLGFDAEVAQHLGPRGTVLLSTPGHSKYRPVRKALKHLPGFRRLEPNFILESQSLPNDPRFTDQYALNNTGQTGGVAGADINAPQAWDLTTGDPSVIVAVLDSGVDYNHPDLVGALWTNPAEVAGNGADDDHNGHIDDTRGWDFAANDNDPMDVFGHGTHVTGILAAKGDNAIGIAGMAWGVKVLPVRFLDNTGNGTVAGAISSVNYVTTLRAQGHNIRVLNASWGEYAHSVTLYNAIAAAGEAGVLVVAAAGNHGRDIDQDSLAYRPAAFDLPNILSIAATDHSDHLAGFSNYGQTRVDIAAPGDAILSTQKNNSYGNMFGTSMAAPLVSGLAALAFSVSPAGTPYGVVREAILDGGDTIAALAGRTVTGRRVNAYRTLLELPLAVLSTTPGADQQVHAAPTNFTVRFSHPVAAATLTAVDFSVNGTTADSVTLSDSRTAVFHFDNSPVDASRSVQAMTMAAGGVARAADGRGLAAFASAFRYDPLPMQVVATTPAAGATPPLGRLDVTFNEAVDPATTSREDLVLSRGAAIAAELVSPTTVQFTLAGVDAEGPVQWSLPAGAVADAAGNPNPAFAGSLDLDVTLSAFGSTFSALAPAGSLIQRAAPLAGLFNTAGDSDSYTLELSAGQKVSARTTAGTLSLRNAAGQVVAGPSVVLQSAGVETGGVYTLTVIGESAGAYALDVLLNSAFEMEMVAPGLSNDTPAAAQPLGSGVVAAVLGRMERPAGFLPTEVEPNDVTANSASGNFVASAGSAFHVTARGTLSGAEDSDYFSLGQLDPGDVLAVSLSGVDGGRGTLPDAYLQLYRGSPDSAVIVDDDDDGGPGRDSLLYGFPVSVADTYYLRVRQFPDEDNPPPGGSYELAVHLQDENAATTPAAGSGVTADAPGDDTLATATELAGHWGRISRVATTRGSIASPADRDLFSYSLSAGDVISVHVAGAAGLETRFVLRDSAGNVVAADDGLSAADDANSAAYGLVIPVAGVYSLEVLPQGGVGDYAASVSLASASPPAAPPATVTDVYALGGGQPGRITLTPFTDAAVEIRLLDAGGGQLGSVTSIGAMSIPVGSGVAYIAVAAAPDLEYTLLLTHDLALEGMGGDDHFAVRFAWDQLRVWVNSSTAEPPTYVLPRLFYSAMSIHGNGGEDSLEVIGDAALAASYRPGAADRTGVLSAADVAMSFASVESLTADTFSSVTVVTPNANDSLMIQGDVLQGSSGGIAVSPLSLENVQTLVLDTAANDDAPVGGISNAAASVDQIMVSAQTTALLRLVPGQGSNSLALADDARAVLAPGASGPLRLSSLNISPSARLDVTDNELMLSSMSLSAVLGYLADGRLFTSLVTPLTTLAAVALEAGGVRVKHTRSGDADLDGRVGISDFFAADRGRALRLTGWQHGDFDLSGGPADAEDFMLLDRGFLAQ